MIYIPDFFSYWIKYCFEGISDVETWLFDYFIGFWSEQLTHVLALILLFASRGPGHTSHDEAKALQGEKAHCIVILYAAFFFSTKCLFYYVVSLFPLQKTQSNYL